MRNHDRDLFVFPKDLAPKGGRSGTSAGRLQCVYLVGNLLGLMPMTARSAERIWGGSTGLARLTKGALGGGPGSEAAEIPTMGSSVFIPRNAAINTGPERVISMITP